MDIIDVPAAPHWREGFEANQARIARRRVLLVRRRVPWQLRKYYPGMAHELEQRMHERLAAVAKSYHLGIN